MTLNHLHPDDFIGYIYQTLNDAQRETINAHLLECPICREKIAAEKRHQRQISNELSAALKNTAPGSAMKFSSIAPQLATKGPISNLWPRLAVSLPVTLAFVGFLLSLTGLWQIISTRSFAETQPIGALPTLACFFLILASVEQFDRSLSIRPRYIVMALIAFILWLSTALIGLLNLIVIRDLAIMFVISLGGSTKLAAPFSIFAVLLGALGYIGVVFGGAEYHYKNTGQPGSWKLFSITLLGQLIILILPYLVF